MQNPVRKDLPVFMVTEGTLRGHQWVMYGEELVIGRGAHCEIMIPERQISREHARVWREGSRCMIEDLDSKNGTFVNSVRIDEPYELHEGDELQIAMAIKMRFIAQEATVPLDEDVKLQETAPPPGMGLYLEPRTRQVYVNNISLEPQLSLYQYRLLELLYQRQGAVCTRDDIIQYVWPDAVEEGVSEQAIDALVRRLRDRLAEIEPEHQFIITVRGHGFRLEQLV